MVLIPTFRLIGRAVLLAALCAGGLAAQNCKVTSVGLIPLPDLGPETYQGYPGGLYPGGVNYRPVAHDAAGLAEAAQVVARNAAGIPDPQNGRIVLLSIGMSNTSQEFSEFARQARLDRDVHPQVVIVNGAQGGQTAQRIAIPTAAFWSNIDTRLQQAGVTSAQVQAIWFKEADSGPRDPFPGHAKTLKTEFIAIMNILRTRYPNARLCYLSSRIYAGYATTTLNPEPYAYESGFAVKWTLEDQLNARAELNFDPKKGPVRSPWLAWGPYLWADGLNPRSDGLIYLCSDFRTDGTHPSASGTKKVASQLLDFFKTDATAKTWFLRTPTPVCPASARVDPYGTGVSGPNGVTRIVAGSLPTVPTAIPFRLQAWGAPGSRPGMFLFGLAAWKPGEVPLLGGWLLVQAVAGFSVTTDTWGKAALELFPLPASPAWCGLTFHFQVIVEDPDSPQGYDLSKGLRITVGH